MNLSERIENDPKRARGLDVARFIFQVTEHIAVAMELSGVDEKGLAEKLGVDESAIVHMMEGRDETPVALFAAALHELGYRFEVRMTDRKFVGGRVE